MGDDTLPRSDAAAILAAVRAIGAATDSYRRAVIAECGLGTADLAQPPAARSLPTGHATVVRIRIVIDDFGTGYPNLSHLHRLPLCGLKLDASFIREIDDPRCSDPPEAKIVAALIMLAHNLKLTVTAEGVETRTQLDPLRALGCDTAQGWLFTPAGPAAVITRHLGRPPALEHFAYR